MADALIDTDGGLQTWRRDDGTEYAIPEPGGSLDNERTLRTRAVAALDANAIYLALAAPTNAQNAAQVKALTRECSGLIRLLLGRLEDTTGT